MSEERPVLELMGAPGSPYTRKMLSLMRFRRIPYQLTHSSRHLSGKSNKRVKPRPEPKVHLLPTFYLKNENGEEVAVTDSSPLLRRFEKEYRGRSVIPPNPVMTFIDMLLEDFGDEWLTKSMFHYRWSYEADIYKAGEMLPRWGHISGNSEEIGAMSKFICERQISRLSYVGSNEITAQTIEDSFKRIIHLLDDHLAVHPYLMGERPGSSDFAFFGQLTCLALFDPTPQGIIIAETPRVYAWVEVMEDLSGYEVFEEDWIDPAHIPDTLKALLGEAGRLYAPYLIANAEAVMSGAQKMQMTLDGRAWEQNPFVYQAKCLRWIREAYTSLDEGSRATVNAIVDGTGLEQLVE